MDDIAAKAEVNKATVYYHIGGKERIYEVVLYQHLKAFADTLDKRLEGIEDPVEALLELVHHHAEVSMADDRGSRTVAHELAGGARRMTPGIVTQYARVYAATIRVIQTGIRAGRLRNLHPAFAHLLLASPLFMSAINRPFRPRLFNHELIRDQPPLSHDELVALLEQVIGEFFLMPAKF